MICAGDLLSVMGFLDHARSVCYAFIRLETGEFLIFGHRERVIG